jgi:hypothetical protein
MARRRTPGPYLPIDINFDGNPKIVGLSDGAFRLHICGMLYCKRQRVDGILSAAVVPTLTRGYRPRQLDELIDRLLWVELNGSGHYEIHDWLTWNLAASEARERSDMAREAAHKRWET